MYDQRSARAILYSVRAESKFRKVKKKSFLKHVSRDLGKTISDVSGISSTRELGKYLGMPVLQKRINKDIFSEVLEKVSSRLAGWKGQLLSFAGRITLAKAVISSIPVHTMSRAILPQSMLNRLDKVLRSFIWGDRAEKRKQHLIFWERVCVPKSEGVWGFEGHRR
ncbi:unnamed protein product [Microthlaspi erraticum]|uniref:Uncharacterized protein n=1 Tax=Microthlaspi erraticum TaxID=1685480 RepID=A0A6D2JMD5_9BRAS|nr:unnamed protein product [Microthlaspi erraticum]